MTDTLYYILSGAIVLAVLFGIFLTSRVKSAVYGNLISAAAVIGAIVVTFFRCSLFESGASLGIYIALAVGLAVGLICSFRVKMIEMPQTVAVLNGLGGFASLLIALSAVLNGFEGEYAGFETVTAGLAMLVGMVTLVGSAIAAGKLAKLIKPAPVKFKGQSIISAVCILGAVACCALMPLVGGLFIIPCAVFSAIFGLVFVMRVGGADMPITISLLNSLSGVAGGIAGMATGDPLLVAIGGIVGASGLILTQDMCKAMNRSLSAILTGKTTVSGNVQAKDETADEQQEVSAVETVEEKLTEAKAFELLKTAKDIIIVPGYGMALSQAQQKVADLAGKLEKGGARVRYAIHPVAGRMPGHMSVLLCEAGVPYEQLSEMDEINDDFANCDMVVSIGSNDVMNPAANTAEDTPIYGMPVLKVDEAPYAIICNFDDKPGYAGVPNPIYKKSNVLMLLGDAKESIDKLTEALR